MKSAEETIASAKRVLKIEADTIYALQQSVGESFYQAVRTIFHSKGRTIITGVGKSAIIAQKIVATFNSTGTPAIFMHGADAVHGDLGMLQKGDVVICISHSGNTPEIKLLIPWLKSGGNPLIGMVGNSNSYLAKQADFTLLANITQEACPNNLAPTSSTTAQLALGDALAVCLLEWRNFKAEDFARYHPGGALGKRLYLRVSDLYLQNAKPQVFADSTLQDVIMEITSNRLGATVVINDNEQVAGIITDGDLRRLLTKTTNLENIHAADIMSPSPKTILPEILAAEALEIMRERKITQLIVAQENKYLGVIHIHDLNREGLIS
ncbi:MAG: KpsF/GutQ family sugar-phosphate isomerase [Sphingobacteriales bacterium]|nr:MAG: KpsF/GutQ family sugar-phosphate isomerase [Sphingobacteriales bacterium]